MSKISSVPKGITGFGGQTADPPRIGLAAFRSDCYSAARKIGGRVILKDEEFRPGVVRNFAIFVIDAPQAGRIAILMNTTCAILSFAKAPEETQVLLSFLDLPELESAFCENRDYLFWSAAQLSETATSNMYKDLDPDELKQVKYWKPNTLGDLAFNFWD
ncbi:MAG TPA: hypothetical protein V6C86_14960 [Oculatellaceae cyanobacterium]